jgi:glycosyltransferase involved in cell wall biosynthesis
MKISVVVTTYNRPDALVRVLEGLSGQTRPADEIQIADDGSGMETARLIQGWQALASCPIHHVWHQDQGFRAAAIRNRAVRRSSGDYLIFLDGDCIPHPRFVADHEALAYPGCYYQGKRVLIGQRITPVFSYSMIHRQVWRFVLSRDLGNAHHLLHLPFWPVWKDRDLTGTRSCNLGVFRTDLTAVNGFNQDFEGWGREDSELAARLLAYGLTRRQHPFRAICFHLWHPQQDRRKLSVNNDLLQQTIKSKRFRCDHGLDTAEND